METRFATRKDTIASRSSELAEIKANLAAALQKIDDLENRGRLCNIRIISLPEGTNAVSFLHSWLPDLLGLEFKHGRVKKDFAHLH